MFDKLSLRKMDELTEGCYFGFLRYLLAIIGAWFVLGGIFAAFFMQPPGRNKLSEMRNEMLQLRTSLTQYYVDHNSYPPAYGYRLAGSDVAIDVAPANAHFFVSTLYAALQLYREVKLYDVFSASYSTSPARGSLRLLEFSPIARSQEGTAVSLKPVDTELYDGSNLREQVIAQLKQPQRPYIYLPVNRAQFEVAKKYWLDHADWLASKWDADDPALATLQFPPYNYDAYALISVGPEGNTFGVIADPPAGGYDKRDVYHITVLRAYFLATRDLNGNGLLDFAYDARKLNEEWKATYTVMVDGKAVDPTPTSGLCADGDCYPNSLPATDVEPNGYGPYIYNGE